MAVDGFDGLFFFSKYDEAIKDYDKAIRLEKWALLFVKQGNYGGAAKAYEEAIRAYDTAI